MLAGIPWPALGQGSRIKLSDGQSFSDVVDFKISPTGDCVVFTHDADVDGALELWSVPVAGGAPVRLSASLPAGSQVSSYAISPDGLRAVYVAPQDTPGVDELYSVPIGGGAAVKLNDALVDQGNVIDIKISPDGGRVVYRADQEIHGVVELYSVPITGGAVTKLNSPLDPDDHLFGSYQISPDSSRVVYITNRTPPDVNELYSAPIVGGSFVKLNGELPVGGNVGVGSGTDFRISPDSSRVVYLADQDSNDRFELYSVPITGGAFIKLNGDLVTGGNVASDFQISPDGSRVIYLARQDSFLVSELYRVSITGGAVTKISGPIVVGGMGVRNGFAISPDGSRAVFLAIKSQLGVFELYSVRINLALPALAIRLNSALSVPDEVREFQISPDSNWVVYRATSMSVPLGYRVPIAGGPAEAIWDNPTQVVFLQDYKIAPGSDHVVVRGVGANPADGTERLWWAGLIGPASPSATELIRLADFPSGGNVTAFDIGPNGKIVYIADQEFNELFELYTIPTLGLLFADGFE